MKNVLIITGGSKGLGRGIVEAYQTKGYDVYSLSRSRGKFIDEEKITQITCDLSKEEEVQEVLLPLFKELDRNQIDRILLINNAGTLGEVGRTENLKAENIASAVKLNTLAPLLLSATFISLTKNWSCQKKIINISSGAAQNPYYGWSIYCATKAALDMMTKVVALEQQEVENGVCILSISPGIVDTDMQTEIRKHKKEDFKDIDRFLEFKALGSLADPRDVGVKIYNLDQKQFENGSILRVDV